MTWQPEPADSGRPDPVGQYSPRRRRSWVAVLALLAVGLIGLAVAAAGVADELLPRRFSVGQQRQITTWEMSRRWRADPAGQIFPASIGYQVPAQALGASQGLQLSASRLGIAPEGSCAADVSAAAAQVLASGRCVALLRATYVDASQSMVVTLGIAVLPDTTLAFSTARRLSEADHGLALAVRPFPVSGTAAAGFRDKERQLAFAVGAGPYVIMSVAGFADGRQHVELSSDVYYDQEMTSLADGLADSIAARIGAPPPVPSCPGAPGC